jgi:acyl carrier protein
MIDETSPDRQRPPHIVKWSIFTVLVAALFAGGFCLAISTSRRRRAAARRARSGTTRGRVLGIVGEILKVDAAELDATKPLTSPEVGADDLDVAEIVMGIEDEFGIRISDDKVVAPGTEKVVITLNQLVKLVEELIAKRR